MNDSSHPPPSLDCTERMDPADAHPRTFWEHVARYRFAARFVRGKRVLDVACGEGYGAAVMVMAGAASVVGVDIAADVCERARANYGLDARFGDASALPLPDRSVNLIVSFETIEHVDNPSAFLRECTRVLDPAGTLVISTPNRPVYADGPTNPYHKTELDEDEFTRLLKELFKSVHIYTQYPRTAAPWSLRSLVAERSPWLKVRGFWRVSSWFCPKIRNHLDPTIRKATDRAILGREGLASRLFDPYLVRPRSRWSGEQPYILIAVAEGVRPA